MEKNGQKIDKMDILWQKLAKIGKKWTLLEKNGHLWTRRTTMKKLIKKIKKKIKRWLAHKIGVYTIEDIPLRNLTIVSRPVECISLNIAISNDAWLFESEAGLDFVKLRIKKAICDFALKELPKYMSFATETSPAGPYRIVKCRLDVVPPKNEDSLANLFAEKETEGNKEKGEQE